MEIALLSFLLALMFLFFENQQRLVKILFMILTDVFLISYGVLLVNSKKTQNINDHYSHFISSESISQFHATVNEIPIEKEKTLKLKLKINAVKVNEEFVPAGGEVIAYFRKSEKARSIQAGNDLLVETKLIKPDPPMNPFEFDYRRSLELKHIEHICFADNNSYAFIPESKRISAVWEYGLKAKEYVLSTLKNSGLSSEAAAVCSALLTGYDEEIDRELMNAFSHSGTLHVLSVSGLHVGLFYLVLSFLFGVFDRKEKFPFLKFIFITAGLWILALITGFSAPIVRSVIMFSLFGIGKIYFSGNPRNTINILFVSAFILLNFEPNLLLDIGFQLSYSAMFGIIYFTPKFEKIWPAESKLNRLIRGSVIASVAGTLSTLPFTLFYFKQFPLWFALCNLIVVPASFLIMILAFFLLFKFSFITLIINGIVSLLTEFITLFNHPDFGYIDNIDFDLRDAFFISLILLFVSLCFYKRSYTYAVWTFVFVLLWQMNSILISYQSKNVSGLTVYQIKKNSVSAVKNKTEVIMHAVDKANYDFHLRGHFISFNHPDVQVTNFNYVNIKNSELLFLSEKGKLPSLHEIKPCVIVLSHDFQLTDEVVQKIPENVLVISDGSNGRRTKTNTRRICSKFGLSYYDTSEEGAFVKVF